MTLRLLNPKGLYDSSPNAYSQVAILESSRRLAFISGQGGDNPDGSFSPDFATQARDLWKESHELHLIFATIYRKVSTKQQKPK